MSVVTFTKKQAGVYQSSNGYTIRKYEGYGGGYWIIVPRPTEGAPVARLLSEAKALVTQLKEATP